MLHMRRYIYHSCTDWCGITQEYLCWRLLFRIWTSMQPNVCHWTKFHSCRHPGVRKPATKQENTHKDIKYTSEFRQQYIVANIVVRYTSVGWMSFYYCFRYYWWDWWIEHFILLAILHCFTQNLVFESIACILIGNRLSQISFSVLYDDITVFWCLCSSKCNTPSVYARTPIVDRPL
jgi:hypothetical protein